MFTDGPSQRCSPAALALLPALVLALAPERAAAIDPLDVVPADALLVWRGQPFPDTTPAADQPGTLATLLDVGARLAGQPLPPQTQIALRLIEALGTMVRYPHALALIDARAKPLVTDADARKVDQLKLVLAVQTRGKSEPFLRIVQKVVNEQTDANVAELRRATLANGSYQELRDKRLADWAVVAWGEIDDCFVLTLGADVWPLVARTAAGESARLRDADWVVQARTAQRPNPLIEIFVAVRDIRARLDPFVHGRATDFFAAWHAADIERAHWAFGFAGDALFCEASFVKHGAPVKRVFTALPPGDALFLRVVPPRARYAVYQLPMGEMIPRFFAGIVATRDPAERRYANDVWNRIQSDYQFDAQRDLLAQFGDRWILHNYPPHPLHLPVAMTTLTEIRGDARRVRDTIAIICRAWQDATDRLAAKTGVPPWATIVAESDGVWYLQFGLIAGPACTVTDRYLITSWSPAALRDYLDTVGDAAGKRLPPVAPTQPSPK
ncbi:MAG: hypothetical protein AB7Q17_17455 [Phycisphaerae bacterium]